MIISVVFQINCFIIIIYFIREEKRKNTVYKVYYYNLIVEAVIQPILKKKLNFA